MSITVHLTFIYTKQKQVMKKHYAKLKGQQYPPLKPIQGMYRFNIVSCSCCSMQHFELTASFSAKVLQLEERGDNEISSHATSLSLLFHAAV